MTSRPWIIVIPGSRWDDIVGTDRQLAVALAERNEVLWLDPPYPATALLRAGAPARLLHEVAPGVHRLQPLTVPAGTRPGLRDMAHVLLHRQLERELRQRCIDPIATVVMTPRGVFPRRRTGVRVLFVTDDWVAGAPLMGLSQPWVRGRLVDNLTRADLVAAVTPELAAAVSRLHPTEIAVIPNGTQLTPRVPGGVREPLVGVVGQLNERLDLRALAEVADRGVAMLVVGPRTERDPRCTQALDALLARSNVEWIGAVPYQELPASLARLSVGLTPYADTEFNRSSFPLKTLEYLASGIPVVSTDLPAARRLETRHVVVEKSPERFADAVEWLLIEPPVAGDEEERRSFAARHTWAARADQLRELIDRRG